MPAAAQVATDVQASASAGVGVTTNVANTPVPDRRAPKGSPAPEWDGFGDLLPAVQLVVETPRTTNTFVYALDYHYYFVHHEANAISNSLGYTLGAALSPTTDFALGVSASQTQLSVFNIVGSGQASQPLPTGTGNDYLFTGAANEALTVATSELDTFSEGGSFTATYNLPSGQVAAGTSPTLPTETYLASGTLVYGHSFRSDSLGAEIDTTAGVFPALIGGGAIIPPHTDIEHGATIGWHHAYSDAWSTTLAAGALVAYQAADLKPRFQPDGTASVDFAGDQGAADLTYTHAVTPNIILGEMVLTDSVALRGGIPLGWTGLDLSGTGAFVASRPLLSAAESAAANGASFGTTTYTALVDGTLGYQRDPLPLRFELRYQFQRQFSLTKPPCTPTEPPPYCSGTPNPNILPVPEIRRQNLELVVTYFFPHTPPVGTSRPTLVPLPSPTSNPGTLSRGEPTRGQIEDSERQDAEDRKKRSDKSGASGGDSPSGGSPSGGESK